jgi:predicted metal-binding protein
MKNKIKIGIIICDRYSKCAGGKCLRSLHNREGAFRIYEKNKELELIGYTTCGGCPGGNIEYAPEEMVKNGVQTIHLATGLIVGYPPCPYMTYFHDFINKKYGIEVIYGTHPIPQKYYSLHTKLVTWNSSKSKEIIQPILASEKIRLSYD